MPFAAGLFYHLHPGDEVDTSPLVLIHGVGGMHLDWPPEIRRMPGHRVYALDLPGHGKSSQCSGRQSIEVYADQVILWLRAVRLPKAVFIGHGMGGEVVLSLAHRYAEYMLGLALLGTYARLDVPPDLLEYSRSSTTFYKAVETLTQSAYSAASPLRLMEVAAKRMAEIRPSVLYGDLLASQGFDSTGFLTDIHLPALVMCGADDRLTPLRYSQFLSGSIPNAHMVTIPQAGHMLMVEKPLEVAEALRAFLDQIPYRLSEAF